MEQRIDTVQNDVNKSDDPKFVKFKQQVDNIPLESNETAIFNLEGTVEELVEEYNMHQQQIDNSAIPLCFPNQITDNDKFLNKVEEELQAAGTGWGDEFEEYISTSTYS